jgi:signal peptidase II
MQRPVIRLQSLRSILIVAISVLFFDQLSKLWVERSMDVNQSFHPIPALSDLLSITYVTNTGAAFGFFKESGTFYFVLALIALAWLLYLFARLDVNPGLARAGLTLAVSGAISNVIDRLRLGYLIDFIDFKFWPIFNLADAAIVSGMVLILIAVWSDGRPRAVETTAPDA